MMLDSITVWFIADTLVCTLVALASGLLVGPRLAAKRVRVEAPDVFEEALWPQMEPRLKATLAGQLAGERAGILADVRALLLSDEDGGVRSFLAADVANVLEGAKAKAKQEAGAFAHGAVDPTDARAQREVLRAQRAGNEGAIVAAMTERIGPEATEAVVAYAKRVAPEAWKVALKDPEQAPGILGPFVRVASRLVRGDGAGEPARPAGPAAPF